MLSATANFNLISRDLNASLARTADEPTVERASADYLAELPKITSIDDFLSNDKVYRFAMKAFGLEDMTYAKAFMRKVLEEGVSDSGSFANTLNDAKYKAFATAFDFAGKGAAAVTGSDAAGKDVVSLYVRQQMEEDAGNANEGSRLALYFQRKAASITSPYALLADPALLQVVQTAFGISTSTGQMDIDKQAAMYAGKLDIASLKDPAYVQEFLGRFVAMYDAQNSSTATTSPALTLITGTSSVGIDSSLLLSLQTYRSKGY